MKKYFITGAFLFLCMNALFLWGCEKTSYMEKKEDSAASEDVFETEENAVEEADAEDTSSDVCFVQVAGAVNSPGVYQVSPESRVYEVIDMAGGMAPDADERNLNQAEKIHDGQKIYVYSVEETVDAAETDEGSRGDGLININTASKEELMTLPGIGESKADDIISYRESHGQFTDVTDIMNIPGIKEGIYNKISEKIKVY